MTHPTDFRALCAQAADFLMKVSEKLASPDDLNDLDQLEFRLRSAALSAAPQQGANDEIPSPLCVAGGCTEQANKFRPGSPMQELLAIAALHLHSYDRLLIRYGTQPAPVPVAERPWERNGWCDEQGHCWFVSAVDPLGPMWQLDKPSRVEQQRPDHDDRYTHSLPHWALPKVNP